MNKLLSIQLTPGMQVVARLVGGVGKGVTLYSPIYIIINIIIVIGGGLVLIKIIIGGLPT